MSHALADHVMHSWLAQVIRRQRGEASGIRAVALHLAGNVSDCCGVPVQRSRSDAYWLCTTCRRPCRIGLWRPKAGLRRVKLHKPQPRRGLEDLRRARELDGFLYLQRIVEPRPRDSSEAEWRRCLAAYGLQLLEGYCEGGSDAERARFDRLATAGFGARSDWSTWTYRQRIRDARAVVGKRARLDRATGGEGRLVAAIALA